MRTRWCVAGSEVQTSPGVANTSDQIRASRKRLETLLPEQQNRRDAQAMCGSNPLSQWLFPLLRCQLEGEVVAVAIFHLGHQ